jgi:hypothetical protein
MLQITELVASFPPLRALTRPRMKKNPFGQQCRFQSHQFWVALIVLISRVQKEMYFI